MPDVAATATPPAASTATSAHGRTKRTFRSPLFIGSPSGRCRPFVWIDATIGADRRRNIGGAYASSRSRLPISTPLHAAPADELVHHGLEAPAVRGQRVLDRRRAGVQHAPVEEARLDELVQSRGQGRGG